MVNSCLNHLISDPNVDINTLDIPVNAVATALKDFFSKRLPPLFTEDLMGELEDLSGKELLEHESMRVSMRLVLPKFMLFLFIDTFTQYATSFNNVKKSNLSS